MKLLPAVTFVASLALLHGCAIAPGQHMDVDALQDGNSHVQLVQIDAQTLAQNQTAVSADTVPQELLQYQPQPYEVGPGDTLYITVWDHPELTSPAGSQQQTVANGRLVRPDGTLFYPYVGTVQAAGMSIEQLRKELTSRLSKFIPSPQVDVGVVGYNSHLVTLAGAFTKTEVQPVTAVPMTLAQAIGNAGINTEQADLSDLILTRDGHNYHLDLNQLGTDVTQDIYLKPGDRLFLPYNDQREVYVLGEVLRPMSVTYKTGDLNLTQVLGRAGGINPVTANARAVYVIRGVKDLQKEPATVYHLNARSPSAYALADNFTVRPGDVVWVGPSGITSWNRVLSQLLPLSGLVSQAALTNQRLGNGN